MLMSSGDMLDSKMSAIYTTTDTHELFTDICQLVTELEAARIVEKLARPISRETKVKLMDSTN